MIRIGSVVVFTGVQPGYSGLVDVTLGKEYVIEGFDEDGDAYFIDDAGERDFAAGSGGIGIYEIVEE